MNWNGKRVLLTGHTGFKGSWLSLWLQRMGADVCGLALEPPTQPNLFHRAEAGRGIRSVIGDIRDVDLVRYTFAEHCPEVVFHLAAQPLVRSSYVDPLGTYATNVMGTANILDAARAIDSVRAIVVVTTDKCYENYDWEWAYRETDRLGGFDPFSSSKACAEFVVSAYRNSFFNPAEYARHGVAIASVRAGNVIGGGDWAQDRLVPDAIRAFMEERPVRIRNPRATRPWQHVLEPLHGYLAVAEALLEQGAAAGEAWNFGPDQSDAQPVEWIVNELAKLWGQATPWEQEPGEHLRESQNLRIDCLKAEARLGWRPLLELNETLALTVAWYKESARGQNMHAFTLDQIAQYEDVVLYQRQSQPAIEMEAANESTTIQIDQ